MITEAVETCSCGSQVEIRGMDLTDAVVKATLATWRDEHKHEKREPDPVSTTAKGDFGYVRYAQGSMYEDDDEDEED